MKKFFLIATLILCLLIVVSCEDNKVEEENSGVGYISVKVPPVRSERSENGYKAITNAEAASICDDYYLIVVFEDGTHSSFRYSSQANGFNKIPLATGTYQLVLLATNTTKKGQLTPTYAVVGIGYCDEVEVQQYQLTPVSMTLQAIQFSYDFLSDEHYANSADQVKITLNKPSSLNNVFRLNLYKIYSFDNYGIKSELAFASSGLGVFIEGESDNVTVSYTLPTKEGNYDLDFVWSGSLKVKGTDQWLYLGSSVTSDSIWFGTSRHSNIYDLADYDEELLKIYETSLDVTMPPTGITLDVSWVED